MRRTLATAVLAMALSAPTADARPHRMSFEFARLVAVDYWAQRAVAVPCRPSVALQTTAQADAMSAAWGFPVAMWALRDSCQVAVTPMAEVYRTDVDLDWLYCADVVHEVGHLAGLGHEYGGVMNPAENVVPFGCAYPRQWAVLKGWRKPPRWVRRSNCRAQRLWLAGKVWRAQEARQHRKGRCGRLLP